MRAIHPERIIIVPKIPALEYVTTQHHLTREEVLEKWEKDGQSKEEIEASIKAQENHEASLGILRSVFPERNIIARDSFTKKYAVNADAIIALGGDDHLWYVSHFLSHTPVIGINSDPVRSNGNRMHFIAEDIHELLSEFAANVYGVESWTRLEATIYAGDNVVRAIPAASQYAIFASYPGDMTRLELTLKGESEKQRGSGLIVATGAGSTGWYRGASKYSSSDRYEFPPTAKMARAILREPYENTRLEPGQITTYQRCNPEIIAEDELSVKYFTHREGIFDVDALVRYPLARGNKIMIRISSQPLNVVTRIR